MITVFYNALVYTGSLPLRSAFVVENNTFVFVGTDTQALAYKADRFVNMHRAFVCPGFIDSHMHLLGYGHALAIAPLARHTSSLEEMLHCLAQTGPGIGGWILGRGWNQDMFAGEKRFPTRYDLDKVSQTAPVCAVRACGHALCVNSKALELLNITQHTPQTEGGCIVMENGSPNGVFLDNAMDIVYSALPAPAISEIKSMLRAAAKDLNSRGITFCHSDDYSAFQTLSWQDVNTAYEQLEQAGEMTVRVYQQANFSRPETLQAFLQAGNKTGTGTDMFRIGPLKLLGDGALGARTAYLSVPYADEPSARGLSVFTAEELNSLVMPAHAAGMQIAIHCIGDACLDMALNSLEKALAQHPRKDHRHGIVHCQIMREDQHRRFARLGMHAYVQSIFLDYDIHIVHRRVGDTLAQSSYCWKSLMQKGCSLSNGSDCPVETPNVLAGIQCAVTRKDLKGNGPYLPQQAFTVEEALNSFTRGGAYAAFAENSLGQILPGMLADFVVLAQNPFDTPAEQIKDITVLQTWVNGKQVYCAN